MSLTDPHSPDASQLCQSCGACCAYSAAWPRFSLESDPELDVIPEPMVAADLSGMRCEDDRCVALTGIVGQACSCSIYSVRPLVCRSCMPGDPECTMARAKYGFAAIAMP